MSTNDIAAKPTSNGRATAFLTALLVASVGLNAGLAYKLRQFLDAQEARLAKMEARSLKPGTSVPPFSAKRVGSGTVETFNYQDMDRLTVLYVLSPACGWCAKNESSIKKLVVERGSAYRFIGISLAEEGAEKYTATHDLGIPIYTGLSEEVKKAYKMAGTPQTIVISAKGIVVASWNGAYVGKQKEAVEDFFRVKLPDIDVKITH